MIRDIKEKALETIKDMLDKEVLDAKEIISLLNCLHKYEESGGTLKDETSGTGTDFSGLIDRIKAYTYDD